MKPGAGAVPLGGKLPGNFPLAETGPCCAGTRSQHKKNAGRALLLGDLSPAGSVALCWGLPASALSLVASRQSQSAEEGEITSFESA